MTALQGTYSMLSNSMLTYNIMQQRVKFKFPGFSSCFIVTYSVTENQTDGPCLPENSNRPEMWGGGGQIVTLPLCLIYLQKQWSHDRKAYTTESEMWALSVTWDLLRDHIHAGAAAATCWVVQYRRSWVKFHRNLSRSARKQTTFHHPVNPLTGTGNYLPIYCSMWHYN